MRSGSSVVGNSIGANEPEAYISCGWKSSVAALGGCGC